MENLSCENKFSIGRQRKYQFYTPSLFRCLLFLNLAENFSKKVEENFYPQVVANENRQNPPHPLIFSWELFRVWTKNTLKIYVPLIGRQREALIFALFRKIILYFSLSQIFKNNNLLFFTVTKLSNKSKNI